MARFTLSPAAEADIESVLAWTHDNFGENARLRYEALMAQAIIDLADDPERLGSASRDDLLPETRTYHLWYSRNHVHSDIGRVRRPRHFVVFRFTAQDEIEVARILHDSMDLKSHLPPDDSA